MLWHDLFHLKATNLIVVDCSAVGKITPGPVGQTRKVNEPSLKHDDRL